MRKPTKLPEISLIESNFSYDPITGVLYRASGSPVRNRDRSSGCMKVRCGRLTTSAARICWALFHRKDPGPKHMVVHINGDPWDNRIENLKLKRL